MGQAQKKTGPELHEVSVDALELRAALGFVMPVMEGRTTIPVIHMARLRMMGRRLFVTVTDLEREVEVMLDAEGDAEFDVLMRPGPLRMLCERGVVTLTHDRVKNEVTTHCDGVTITLRQLIPPEDFPRLPAVKWTTVVTIPEAQLHTAVTAVERCISTEVTRYYLNGIYIHQAGEGSEASLSFVTTNGHVLGRYVMPDLSWPGPGIILPQGAVRTLKSMLQKNGNRQVTIQATDLKFQASVGGRRLHAKTIDGTFPDYTRVIPKMPDEPPIEVCLSRGAIVRLSGIGKALSRDRTTLIAISPDDEKMRIRSGDGDTVEMPITGQGPTFGVNIRYLADMLHGQDIIMLDGTGPRDPFMVRFEDPHRMGVIMPMSV